MSVLAYQIHKWCAILTHTIDFSRFIYSVALRHHHRRHHHPKQLPKSSADIQSVKCDVLKLVSNAREHVWSRYIKYIPGWEKWMDGRQRKTIQSSIIKEGFQENCFSPFHSLQLHFPFQCSFIRVRARRWANKHTHTHTWWQWMKEEVVINVKHLALVKLSSLFPIGEMMSMWCGLMLYSSLCFVCVYEYLCIRKSVKEKITSCFWKRKVRQRPGKHRHHVGASFHSTINASIY